MAMVPSNDARRFRHILRESKNVVAVVGAGLSVASGIPTWRGSGRSWKHKDPASLSSPETFASHPELVWQHYHELRERVSKAEPNAAHFALALLCVPSYLATVAPSARFTLVTQNIDGLDKRALETTLANMNTRERPEGDGSSIGPSECSKIYEIHGRVLDTLCTSCGHLEHMPSLQAPAIQHPDPSPSGDQENAENLPHCDRCGGLLRPGVVWFEELLRHSREVWEAIDAADLCLLIGTSSKVQPAAGFAYEVADHGGKVAVFNIQTEEGDDDRDFLFLGPCESTLPNVLFDIGSEQ